MVRGADEHPIARCARRCAAVRQTYPASMAADAIIQGIEERRRIVVTPGSGRWCRSRTRSAVVREAGRQRDPRGRGVTRQWRSGGPSCGSRAGQAAVRSSRRTAAASAGAAAVLAATALPGAAAAQDDPSFPSCTRNLQADQVAPAATSAQLRHHPRRADRPARHRRGPAPAEDPAQTLNALGRLKPANGCVRACACTASSGPTRSVHWPEGPLHARGLLRRAPASLPPGRAAGGRHRRLDRARARRGAPLRRRPAWSRSR